MIHNTIPFAKILRVDMAEVRGDVLIRCHKTMLDPLLRSKPEGKAFALSFFFYIHIYISSRLVEAFIVVMRNCWVKLKDDLAQSLVVWT
jgi:hypothetical protein